MGTIFKLNTTIRFVHSVGKVRHTWVFWSAGMWRSFEGLLGRHISLKTRTLSYTRSIYCNYYPSYLKYEYLGSYCLYWRIYSPCGPGGVVGITTAYGLDGLGIESRWGGEIFRICPDRPWGPPSLLYNGYRVFLGGKVLPGRDADPSPPSSAEVKKRVELYLYSP